MRYITELHCHTAEVSNCATAPAGTVADIYAKAGYTSLCVMNHLSRFTFGDGDKEKYQGGDDWKNKIAFYMNGIEAVKKAANGRFNVLWGIELRSNTDNNDYLVHGLTEEFLLSNPDIMDAPVKEVAARVHKIGGLFYQAHPFRNNMTVKKPSLLDGIETYNGHPGQDSRNDVALIWADRFGLRKLSGTDFHHDFHIPTGGIVTDTPITTNAELLSVLKSGEYEPLHSGELPFNSKI